MAMLLIVVCLLVLSISDGQTDMRHVSRASHTIKLHHSEIAHSQFEKYGRNGTKHQLATKSRIGIFILSTSKGGGLFFRVNAMGAHDTWARSFPYVFFVMSDNPGARFAFRNCKIKWIEADDPSDEFSNQTTDKNDVKEEENVHFDPPDPFLDKFLTAKCRNEPAVLLTRACDDSYYGSVGPCCKLDVAITFALSKSAESNWFGGEPLKWMLFMDDDNYVRVDAFLDLLYLYEKAYVPIYHSINNNKHHHHDNEKDNIKSKNLLASSKAVSEISMTSNDFLTHYERMFDKSLMCVCKGQTRSLEDVEKIEKCENCGDIFKHENCKEIGGGMPKFTQQLLFNRHALETAREAARRGGMRRLCDKANKDGSGGFDVTHDVGVKVLAWQLQLDICR